MNEDFSETLKPKKLRILNLYAGIGGNRRVWPEESEVTSVEFDPQIAEIYQDLWPNDKIIVTDAHEFLLNEYKRCKLKDYDFIWSSPPCQTHSGMRYNFCGEKFPYYPDFRLYEEIMFLQLHLKDSPIKWCVENVKPYYKTLIQPMVLIDRHNFWSNFEISKIKIEKQYKVRKATLDELTEAQGFLLNKYGLTQTKQKLILRNCVELKTAQHIYNELLKQEV